MHKNIEENIYRNELEKFYLSFFSNKLRVGVIGGGKAATIKVKSLINKNVTVEVISKEFSEDIINIKSENLKLIKNSYYKEFIYDKHIIIIAINDDKLVDDIRKECENNYKIYIDATDFKKGMGAIPAQRNLNNISFAISTSAGNPKGALLASKLVTNSLSDIDEFLGLTGKMRNNIKQNEVLKNKVINFINEEDFKFFWSKGKEKEILSLFLNNDDIDILYK